MLVRITLYVIIHKYQKQRKLKRLTYSVTRGASSFQTSPNSETTLKTG